MTSKVSKKTRPKIDPDFDHSKLPIDQQGWPSQQAWQKAGRRDARRALIIIPLIWVWALLSSFWSPARLSGVVERAHRDGSGFVLKREDGSLVSVRLHGLKPPGFLWAPKAHYPNQQALLDLKIKGKRIECAWREPDASGRYIAQCFLIEGEKERDIAAELRQDGALVEEYVVWGGTCVSLSCMRIQSTNLIGPHGLFPDVDKAVVHGFQWLWTPRIQGAATSSRPSQSSDQSEP